VWTSLPITLGHVEEPCTLTQGAPVFPGSSRLGIEPKTPPATLAGWLVQDRTASPSEVGGLDGSGYSYDANPQDANLTLVGEIYFP